MSRAIELIEGSDGKLSSTKVCTYFAVLVLGVVLMVTTFNKTEPSSEIAFILASLALGTLITNRTADVKMTQAAQGPAPVVTAQVTGDLNVQPQASAAKSAAGVPVASE